MRPLHSIIIPVYNAGNSIERCIKSILVLNCLNIEIILVDDGSTDTSSSICDAYSNKDSRIKVIHQTNSGVSAARNRGIEEASGKWTSFVDADDIVLPSYISYFDKIENKADLTFFGNIFHSNDECDATYCLPNKLFKGRKEIEEGLVLLKQNTIGYEYYGYTWNKFFRTSIIKESNIRFRQGLYFREDEIFTNDYVQHIDTLATMSHIGYEYFYTLTGQGGRQTSLDAWRTYYECSKDFLFSISNESLIRHEYPYVVKACYNSFETETNNALFLKYLQEMLEIVKRYGHLMPKVGRKDYYSSILDYYKDKQAKRRIDILIAKKRIKIALSIKG